MKKEISYTVRKKSRIGCFNGRVMGDEFLLNTVEVFKKGEGHSYILLKEIYEYVRKNTMCTYIITACLHPFFEKALIKEGWVLKGVENYGFGAFPIYEKILKGA